MNFSLDPLKIRESQALIVDSHEVFRTGLAELLKRDCGFKRVFETGSLREAIHILKENEGISFASIELAVPSIEGAFSLRDIRVWFPNVRIAVVSGSEGRKEIILALRDGVHGYVPKTLGISEIASAINVILSGAIFVPTLLSNLVVGDGQLPEIQVSDTSGPGAILTPRQQAVLNHIRKGSSNKEIARELAISVNTVKVHVAALYRILGVRNRYGATKVHEFS